VDAAVHVKDNLNELSQATQLIYRHVKTGVEAEGSYFNIHSKLSNKNSM